MQDSTRFWHSVWKMEGSRAHMDKMEPDTVAILLISGILVEVIIFFRLWQ